jgi:2'-5' RNA ligase
VTALARAFVAVFPPPTVLDAIAAELEALRSLPSADGVRIVHREQWHVTLRFCGRVPDAERLHDELLRALDGVAPVETVRLAGAGAFPSARRASVLWLGVHEASAVAALAGIAAATESACVAAGLPADDRTFRPHVTVARSSRARDLRPLLAALGDRAVGPPWTAAEVRLVASDTRPTGAVHTEIARVPLGS